MASPVALLVLHTDDNMRLGVFEMVELAAFFREQPIQGAILLTWNDSVVEAAHSVDGGMGHNGIDCLAHEALAQKQPVAAACSQTASVAAMYMAASTLLNLCGVCDTL